MWLRINQRTSASNEDGITGIRFYLLQERKKPNQARHMKQWFWRYETPGNMTVILQRQETKEMSPKTALAYCLAWVSSSLCAECEPSWSSTDWVEETQLKSWGRKRQCELQDGVLERELQREKCTDLHTGSSLWVFSRVLIRVCMGGNYPRLRKDFPESREWMAFGIHTGLGARTFYNSWDTG